ncbi:MAG: hypothetical protein KJO98_04380, partial [Rhodothermia bacterium]|nr:hypothetical protein [Rhodothermia bacterium]
MSQNRLYTEKEFGNVLRRASELQQEEGASAAPGLTLNELQHVAKEAGIDPDFVRRAAAELDQEPPEKGDLLFGGPTRLEFKSVVDRKVSGPEWDGAVEVIRHVIGVDGREVLDGPSREWVHQDQMGGRMRVSMTPTDQQTRIHASYRMTEWLWLHFIMVCVGIAPVALQYALLDLGAVTETGIALFTFLAFYMIGWVVFRIFSTRQERKMRGLIARLHKLLTRTRQAESGPIE